MDWQQRFPYREREESRYTHARNEEQLQEAAVHIANLTEGEVLTIQADVTSEADCQRAVEQTVQRFGSLHILVNNAGTSAAQPFEQVGTELWRQIWS